MYKKIILFKNQIFCSLLFFVVAFINFVKGDAKVKLPQMCNQGPHASISHSVLLKLESNKRGGGFRIFSSSFFGRHSSDQIKNKGGVSSS